jgi:hypothetical protein
MQRWTLAAIGAAILAAPWLLASPRTTPDQAPGQAPAPLARHHADPNWADVCAPFGREPYSLAPPAFARPMPEAALRTCDSAALYYGIGRPADPQAALQCAYFQRAHPRINGPDPFYGSGVLTMIFANGSGVMRDLYLAIRFACENSWAAPAEMGYRIAHLERLRQSSQPDKPFDLCDDVTSGLMMGACESISERLADVKRETRLAGIMKGWSPESRRAFGRLQAAEEAFETARTANELDLGGTARAMFVLLDGGLLRDQFLTNLEMFAKGAVSHATPVDERALDDRMRSIYDTIQRLPDDASSWGTITAAGIRKTQDAWLQLRDAWLAFGKSAYPALAPSRLVAQLIRLRIDQLKALAPRFDRAPG